jgi:hypothetical protein
MGASRVWYGSEAPIHARQQRILEVLRERPGLSFTELQAACQAEGRSFGNGVLTWHLLCLERARHVRSIRSGRRRRYFPSAGPWGADLRPAAALLNPTVATIVAAVSATPNVTMKDIRDRTPEAHARSAAWLRQTLRRLADIGVLSRRRCRTTYRYAVADSVQIASTTERLFRTASHLGPVAASTAGPEPHARLPAPPPQVGLDRRIPYDSIVPQHHGDGGGMKP